MSDKLKQLIKQKDNETVKKEIETAGYAFHPSLLSHNGEHLMFWAVVENNLELLEYLLQNKLIHPNLPNYRSTCVLTYACMEDNLEAVKLLLKYHSNPCRRSGFSGHLPKEDTKNLEIIKISEEYEDKYIPIKYYSHKMGMIPKDPEKKCSFTQYQSCKYRLYMYYCAILNNLNIPDNLPHLKGMIKMDKETQEIYRQKGIIGVSHLCDKSLQEFIDTIGKDERYCLNCDATENLLRCSICKNAYFCNRDCQRKKHKFHKFDCKLC